VTSGCESSGDCSRATRGDLRNVAARLLSALASGRVRWSPASGPVLPHGGRSGRAPAAPVQPTLLPSQPPCQEQSSLALGRKPRVGGRLGPLERLNPLGVRALTVCPVRRRGDEIPDPSRPPWEISVFYASRVPLEIGIWRIDGGVARVSSSALADEKRLEDVIEQDISILGLDLLLILGRQVETAYGKKIIERNIMSVVSVI
jgi:hypothetical protein